MIVGALLALAALLGTIGALAWRDVELRRIAAIETRARRFDEAQARKARTAEAERLDALEARTAEIAADVKSLNEAMAARLIARR